MYNVFLVYFHIILHCRAQMTKLDAYVLHPTYVCGHQPGRRTRLREAGPFDRLLFCFSIQISFCCAQIKKLEPYVLHTTYVYGQQPGKRTRLREAGLWLADEPAYFEEPRFLTLDIELPEVTSKFQCPGIDSIRTQFRGWRTNPRISRSRASYRWMYNCHR